MTWLSEREMCQFTDEELNDTISTGDVVPAIRAYLVLNSRLSGPILYNAEMLLREAANRIEANEK